MALSWHSDSFHTFTPPKSSDVAQQMKVHPETNAIIYWQEGYDLIKSIGLVDDPGTGFLVRDGNEWKSKRVFLPQALIQTTR
jgi:hypothetical protein